MVHWCRRTMLENYQGYVLHKEWVLGDIQFGYRELTKKDGGKVPPYYRLYVRKRKGFLGRGRTEWYGVQSKDTHDEICKALNGIIERGNEQYWIDVIDKFRESVVRDEKEALEKKFCGFGSKNAIGYGYK